MQHTCNMHAPVTGHKPILVSAHAYEQSGVNAIPEVFAVLWKRLCAAVPGVSDAELLRQGVALRMALAALDSKGQRPKAFIQYHDQAGKLQTVDLEEHVGIVVPEGNG